MPRACGKTGTGHGKSVAGATPHCAPGTRSELHTPVPRSGHAVTPHGADPGGTGHDAGEVRRSHPA
ncbi:hypothetical protein [Amycolatopsis plumensis]|uniref:hypothetical protein n=1 Tax=Amycolatopsis plumensis TaxID=236508 RepID=UPI00361A8859